MTDEREESSRAADAPRPTDLYPGYRRAARGLVDDLGGLRAELRRALGQSGELPGREAAAELLGTSLAGLYAALAEQLASLSNLPGLPAEPPATEEARLLRSLLRQYRDRLAVTRQRLFEAHQDNDDLGRGLEERGRLLSRQDARIAELEDRAAALQARLGDQEQRAAILPSRLSAALGDAVDSIQQGLSGLENPLIDYALQELELESRVNLEVGADDNLLLRFPGLSEKVDANNLSRLHLRLRPIPKVQPDHGAGGGPGGPAPGLPAQGSP